MANAFIMLVTSIFIVFGFIGMIGVYRYAVNKEYADVKRNYTYAFLAFCVLVVWFISMVVVS